MSEDPINESEFDPTGAEDHLGWETRDETIEQYIEQKMLQNRILRELLDKIQHPDKNQSDTSK